MADAVATRVIAETKTHLVLHFTNISDGTGEAAVKKVDKSTYLAADGAEPAALDIEKISWVCDGMAVRILYDHTTDDLVHVCGGSGDRDFRCKDLDTVPSQAALKDPRTAGDTGDILFTTTGHTSGDSYSITIWMRKQPD